MPEMRYTDNAGNEVKPSFRHYPFILGLGMSRSSSETDD